MHTPVSISCECSVSQNLVMIYIFIVNEVNILLLINITMFDQYEASNEGTMMEPFLKTCRAPWPQSTFPSNIQGWF